jgi:hypothetical protein
MCKVGKAYIDGLKAEVAQRESMREANERGRRNSLGNLKPLTEQITELMLSLPPAQRDRSWSIVDLQGRLQGRYKDRPSLGNIGSALRALGWSQTRGWTHNFGNRRVWVRNI